LFIFNGWTPGDELEEFTCLENGGHKIINYIISSPIVGQVATHLEVIVDDTHYRKMGGNSNHRPLRLRLSIDCNFVEPQHTIITHFFLLKFKYDKSKAWEYQLTLTTSLGNLWVVNSIGHPGADGLIDLLQQCVGVATESTFGNNPSRGRCRERHCQKP
jgi:hypothetical protein